MLIGVDMNTMNIVINFLFVLAFACIFASGLNFNIWLNDKTKKINLGFSIFCAFVGSFDMINLMKLFAGASA